MTEQELNEPITEEEAKEIILDAISFYLEAALSFVSWDELQVMKIKFDKSCEMFHIF